MISVAGIAKLSDTLTVALVRSPSSDSEKPVMYESTWTPSERLFVGVTTSSRRRIYSD